MTLLHSVCASRSVLIHRAVCRHRQAITVMAKARTALEEMGTVGEFKRVESGFRNFVEKGGEFEPESAFMHSVVSQAMLPGGRYHLYISYACPWASRCAAFRMLKASLSHLLESVNGHSGIGGSHWIVCDTSSVATIASG